MGLIIWPRSTVVGLSLAHTGYAGTATIYLALAPVPGGTSDLISPPMAVAKVMIPAAIDRLYLTSATGPNTLHVAAHARWAAPLDGEAQATMAEDLAQRLPKTALLRPGDAMPPGGARLVVVNVTRFLPTMDTVMLDADWRIEAHRHHQVIAAGRAHIVAPSGAAPGAQASAMSAALGRLSDSIVRHLPR